MHKNLHSEKSTEPSSVVIIQKMKKNGFSPYDLQVVIEGTLTLLRAAPVKDAEKIEQFEAALQAAQVAMR